MMRSARGYLLLALGFAAVMAFVLIGAAMRADLVVADAGVD